MVTHRMADIADVYAWMTSDAAQIHLAPTVAPADDGTNHFGSTFLGPGIESKSICTSRATGRRRTEWMVRLRVAACRRTRSAPMAHEATSVHG